MAAVDALTSAVAAQYTGADPTLVPGELRTIIEAAIMNAPRTLQTRIGPSELGVECTRCLAHMLAETPQKPDAAWLPTCGTAVHEWLEGVILRHELTRADLGIPGRYLPECQVMVGTVGGVQITGNADVFDTWSGTVVDWKNLGTTALRNLKGEGANTQYRRQGNLYGKGYEDLGYTVRSIIIYGLPRNGLTLAESYAYQFDYERADAQRTLDRADGLASDIAARGLGAVLDRLPPHTGSGFSCKRYPGETIAALNERDPFGSN